MNNVEFLLTVINYQNISKMITLPLFRQSAQTWLSGNFNKASMRFFNFVWSAIITSDSDQSLLYK